MVLVSASRATLPVHLFGSDAWREPSRDGRMGSCCCGRDGVGPQRPVPRLFRIESSAGSSTDGSSTARRHLPLLEVKPPIRSASAGPPTSCSRMDLLHRRSTGTWRFPRQGAVLEPTSKLDGILPRRLSLVRLWSPSREQASIYGAHLSDGAQPPTRSMICCRAYARRAAAARSATAVVAAKATKACRSSRPTPLNELGAFYAYRRSSRLAKTMPLQCPLAALDRFTLALAAYRRSVNACRRSGDRHRDHTAPQGPPEVRRAPGE